MPAKTVLVRFPEPDIPFEVASELLSYIAYPEDPQRQRTFADCLCRFGHRKESLRNPDWASSPHLIRPRIFAAESQSFIKLLYVGMRILNDRFEVALNVMMPSITEFIKPDEIKNAGFIIPSINESIKTILLTKGRSIKSRPNYLAEIWSPMKPVAHLAFTYAFVQFIKSNNYERNGRYIMDMVTPFPSTSVLIDIINYAEAIRRCFPEICGLTIDEVETISFCVHHYRWP
jgi:hypothetical protein